MTLDEQLAIETRILEWMERQRQADHLPANVLAQALFPDKPVNSARLKLARMRYTMANRGRLIRLSVGQFLNICEVFNINPHVLLREALSSDAARTEFTEALEEDMSGYEPVFVPGGNVPMEHAANRGWQRGVARSGYKDEMNPRSPQTAKAADRLRSGGGCEDAAVPEEEVSLAPEDVSSQEERAQEESAQAAPVVIYKQRRAILRRSERTHRRPQEAELPRENARESSQATAGSSAVAKEAPAAAVSPKVLPEVHPSEGKVPAPVRTRDGAEQKVLAEAHVRPAAEAAQSSQDEGEAASSSQPQPCVSQSVVGISCAEIDAVAEDAVWSQLADLIERETIGAVSETVAGKVEDAAYADAASLSDAPAGSTGMEDVGDASAEERPERAVAEDFALEDAFQKETALTECARDERTGNEEAVAAEGQEAVTRACVPVDGDASEEAPSSSHAVTEAAPLEELDRSPACEETAEKISEKDTEASPGKEPVPSDSVLAESGRTASETAAELDGLLSKGSSSSLSSEPDTFDEETSEAAPLSSESVAEAAALEEMDESPARDAGETASEAESGDFPARGALPFGEMPLEVLSQDTGSVVEAEEDEDIDWFGENEEEASLEDIENVLAELRKDPSGFDEAKIQDDEPVSDAGKQKPMAEDVSSERLFFENAAFDMDGLLAEGQEDEDEDFFGALFGEDEEEDAPLDGSREEACEDVEGIVGPASGEEATGGMQDEGLSDEDASRTEDDGLRTSGHPSAGKVGAAGACDVASCPEDLQDKVQEDSLDAVAGECSKDCDSEDVFAREAEGAADGERFDAAFPDGDDLEAIEDDADLDVPSEAVGHVGLAEDRDEGDEFGRESEAASEPEARDDAAGRSLDDALPTLPRPRVAGRTSGLPDLVLDAHALDVAGRPVLEPKEAAFPDPGTADASYDGERWKGLSWVGFPDESTLDVKKESLDAAVDRPQASESSSDSPVEEMGRNSSVIVRRRRKAVAPSSEAASKVEEPLSRTRTQGMTFSAGNWEEEARRTAAALSAQAVQSEQGASGEDSAARGSQGVQGSRYEVTFNTSEDRGRMKHKGRGRYPHRSEQARPEAYGGVSSADEAGRTPSSAVDRPSLDRSFAGRTSIDTSPTNRRSPTSRTAAPRPRPGVEETSPTGKKGFTSMFLPSGGEEKK